MHCARYYEHGVRKNRIIIHRVLPARSVFVVSIDWRYGIMRNEDVTDRAAVTKSLDAHGCWTSRDRVLTAINHKEPDRVPRDLGSTPVTGISGVTYANSLPYLGLSDELSEIHLDDVIQQLTTPSEQFLSNLKIDVRGVGPTRQYAWKMSYRRNTRYVSFVDEFGIEWGCNMDGGHYFDILRSPMSSAETLSDIDRHPWPDPTQAAYSILETSDSIQRLSSEYPVVLKPLAGGFFEMAFWVRGFEQFYMDLAGDHALACRVMDRLLEIEMNYYDLLLDRIGQHIDIVQEGNDLATQKGLMISPATYRQLVKPRQQKLYSFIKKKAPHVKIMLHSCGAVRDIIPDFIEVGVDILNPVQVSADGMDPAELKRDFGRDLTFWGGGVDTQSVLPHGTPQQVKDEVKKKIEQLAPGGGFVFAAVHNIQHDVPPENLVALWQAVEEYGYY
jgi:uroporphyrinogen decarboxylase